MSLSHLSDLIGPPPPIAPRIDWSEVESQIGSPLPPDYRAFVDLFGPGRIDGFLHVYTPYGPTQWVDLIWASKEHPELEQPMLGFLYADRHAPFPAFPAPGGLLQFAGTDNGNDLYWKTEGDPLQWPVVVFEGRGPEFEVFEMPMTSFLSEILSREIMCGVFPDAFPSQTPRFEPYPPIG